MQDLVSWGRLKLFRIEEYQLKLMRSYFGSGFEALLYDLFSSCVFKDSVVMMTSLDGFMKLTMK